MPMDGYTVFSFALKWIEIQQAIRLPVTGCVFSFALKWIEITLLHPFLPLYSSSASR